MLLIMATDNTAADTIIAASAEYKRFSKMGFRRGAFLMNSTLSSLRQLAISAASEQVRLRACELLIQSEPVRERLEAASDSSRRHSSARARAAQLTAKLADLVQREGPEAVLQLLREAEQAP